jgi:hypothetical protein
MITVYVANANGRTCEVHISWGWTHSNGRTDSSGRVSFDVLPGEGTISVDGRDVYKGRISGTVTVYK